MDVTLKSSEADSGTCNSMVLTWTASVQMPAHPPLYTLPDASRCGINWHMLLVKKLKWNKYFWTKITKNLPKPSKYMCLGNVFSLFDFLVLKICAFLAQKTEILAKKWFLWAFWSKFSTIRNESRKWENIF